MNNIQAKRISSGLPGLDTILNGGLLPRRSYMIKGGPGTGKSTLGYHYLKQGLEEGSESLLITLTESKESVLQNARSMDLNLSELNILDLSPKDQQFKTTETYSVFPSGDVEAAPIIETVVNAVESYRPQRVFLDSITMLRSLTRDPFQYRNLALSFINYICSHGATLLIASEEREEADADEAAFWVDGIIEMEYSTAWRKIRVVKYRGSDFLPRNHAFKITSTGLSVYPRLIPGEYVRPYILETIPSGLEELDTMLNGGVEKGTLTLITGPTGVRKTILSTQFLNEAASRGERSAIYTFEESSDVIINRCKMLNVPIDKMTEQGQLNIVPVQPFLYSPDEFGRMVYDDVKQNNTSIVMIDSVDGYNLSIEEEENSLHRLHALSMTLQNMGATIFVVSETSNITGELLPTDMEASYLADNIIFLRYIELEGQLFKAIGILKKRMSSYSSQIRKFDINSNGIQIGEPYKNLHGILTGLPMTLK